MHILTYWLQVSKYKRWGYQVVLHDESLHAFDGHILPLYCLRKDGLDIA